MTGPGPVVVHGGRVRAAARVFLALAWSAALTLIWTVGHIVCLPVPRARIGWRHRIVRTWARGMARILGMRRRVLGLPPRAPFFLASNHLTYLDIILLYTEVPGVFIAKQEMRHWPVLGPLANLFGTLWVNRTVRRDAVRVLDLIDEAIARGDGVILFAEGTTSSGEALLPMRPALFDWAAREQYPVHHVAISYRTPTGAPSARDAICWWGEVPFRRHLRSVLRLPGFEGSLSFGEAPVHGPTRGELAARVQAAIFERFIPVDSGVSPSDIRETAPDLSVRYVPPSSQPNVHA